ncbi:MAG: restriction endonuclease subunit S, partial [Gammaproteobacteria bacterium]|nr:restriction endonuclease subunit S [Gammaproteobacteria bacterium]
MGLQLQKYSGYQQTDLPWLDEVPAHWCLIRKKYLFEERVQKGYPDEPLLAATQAQGVVRKAEYESRTVEATKDFHLMKLVREGDFVISLRSFEGGIEYAHHQGIISPAYTVLIPRDISEARYYRHLLKSRPFIQGLRLFVTGIREGQNIDYTKLSRTFLPCPPVDECNRIANFLDQKTAEIDEAIAKKQRLIE